ncbi:hypothetical protein [Engelhardtia mirabilis]|uniref:Uncharacterized protein n=1 Tax=Engelhardtia mirabilis TaxID=2528011 RepID=A0A518BNF0_9BACT|nr:hypothetical protein Pla133_35600 [Planctomycetes bacterium Pla133]QDV02788.1 hypothetical protein Pla86_35580 [Planctomycetes bacterium Pla86]
MTGRTHTPLPLVARLGTLIGFTCWAVALGILVATAGEPLLGLELGAIGVACGLGLGQLCLIAVEAVDRADGSHGQRMRVLWGGLLFSTGLLMLVWGVGLMPALAQHPQVVDSLGRVGGDAVLPLWACGALIAVGALLLSLPSRD